MHKSDTDVEVDIPAIATAFKCSDHDSCTSTPRSAKSARAARGAGAAGARVAPLPHDAEAPSPLGAGGGRKRRGQGKPPPPRCIDWETILLRRFPGAKLPEALVCIAVGIIMYTLVPRPQALAPKAWALASIFLATILGLVLEPMPVAPVALTGAVVALLTGTLTYPQAFSAFGNDTIWLILGAFFFAKGVEVTGLGARVADLCIWGLGRSALGLAYALALAELALALCMPSTTARAAGVFVPVITSLARSFDSHPHSPTSKRLGQFLFMSQAQVSSATSALWYLGGAQTPVALNLAAAQGVVIQNPFDTYFKGAVIPSLILVAVIPAAVYLLLPPGVKSTPAAPRAARERLRQRGRPGWREVTMGCTLLGAVALWCASSRLPFPLSNASVALLGVVVLLASGAVGWGDLAAHRPAWELLVWLSILFSMCTALAEMGVIKWLSESVSRPLLARGISTTGLFWLLNLLYCLLHYTIASQTAHVTALFPPFLAIMVDAGIDGRLAALSLAYVTNLFGGLSHYASAQAASYYAAGYYSIAQNFAVGGLVGFSSLAIFMGVGMGWWRAAGLWPA